MVDRLLLLVVHHRAPDDAARLVGQVSSSPAAGRVDVVVVDNSGEVAAAGGLSGATVVRPPANLGYLRGAHWALSLVADAEGLAPYGWVVVANADLELDVAALVAALDELAPGGRGVLVVGPELVDASGGSLNPLFVRRPGPARFALLWALYATGITARAWLGWAARRADTTGPSPSDPRRPDADTPADQVVYGVHGSLVALSRGFFDRGGHLNHPLFLFGEEEFLAEQAIALGGEVVVTHRARVTHRPHGSAGQRAAIDPVLRRHARRAFGYCVAVLSARPGTPVPAGRWWRAGSLPGSP
ncbi:MAG: hypothetical protein IPM45_14675 [Acidimicrobiales bacterium]|nr:hypothetical protein [Acidimicrobiales bacterium]